MGQRGGWVWVGEGGGDAQNLKCVALKHELPTTLQKHSATYGTALRSCFTTQQKHSQELLDMLFTTTSITDSCT